MVGVGKRVAGDFPSNLMLVYEQTHEFSNPDRCVGIIELYGKCFVELVQAYSSAQMDTDHVLQRTGNEEILLLQPQLLPLNGLIIRIENFGDVFCHNLVVDGTVVVSQVELLADRQIALQFVLAGSRTTD